MILALRHLLRDIVGLLGWRLAMLLLWLCLSAGFGALAIAAMLPLFNAAGIGEAMGGGIGSIIAAVMGHVQMLLYLPAGNGGYALLLLIVLSLTYTFFLLHAWSASRLQMQYVSERQRGLFDAILAAGWPFFRQHRAGDLLNTLINEMTRLNAAFYHAALLLAALVHIGIYIVAALLVSWPVTLAILASGCGLMLLSLSWIRRGRRMGIQITAGNGDLQSTATQFLGLAKLVKATATEADAGRSFADIVRRLELLNHWVSFDGQVVRALFELISSLLLIGILVFGPVLVGADAGVILVVIGLFVRIFPRLSGLQQSFQALSTVLPALEAVNALRDAALAQREAVPADDGALPFPPGKPVGVEIGNLSVDYGTGPVLEQVSLRVEPGECVAIVGPSGAGKSTLVDCLLRLANPQQGSIVIDGHPLGALPLAAWRRAVGYMGQESAMLNASVRDNLQWGNPPLEPSAFDRLVAQVEARELIAAMPDGLETLLGDRGRALSGGERQRLALARALGRQPSLLILDEATSALDVATEARIMETIQALKGSITIIMITHRLATVRIADRVCVLESGRLVESGSVAALLSAPSRFQQMWNAHGVDAAPMPHPLLN